MDLLCREDSWFLYFAAHIDDEIAPAGDGLFSQIVSDSISEE